MIVVDTASDAVSGEIVLHGGNPFGDASGIGREPGTGRLVLAVGAHVAHHELVEARGRQTTELVTREARERGARPPARGAYTAAFRAVR
jgi:hypothetical protein